MTDIGRATQRALNAIAGLERADRVAVIRVLAATAGCSVKDHESKRAESAKGRRSRGSPPPDSRPSNVNAVTLEVQSNDTDPPLSPSTPPSFPTGKTQETPSEPPKRRRRAAKQGGHAPQTLESVAVMTRIDDHRKRLGMDPLAQSQRDPVTINARVRDGATLAQLLAVVDARAAQIERGEGQPEYFNATSPFTWRNGKGGWQFSLSLLDRKPIRVEYDPHEAYRQEVQRQRARGEA